MSIIFDSHNNTFHLQGKNTSYIFQVIRGGYLAHLYWGHKIRNYNMSNPLSFIDRGFCANPFADDRKFSLDTIPQEYTTYGNGDFRIPTYEIQLENGSTITNLTYVSHKIFKGKPALNGLPSVYTLSDDEAETLEVTLEDDIAGVRAMLLYTVFNDFNVITRSVIFENIGCENINLLRALSASVDFRDDDFQLITLYGAHTNEKNICRRNIVPGIQMVDSARGASSPQQAPFLALVRNNTTETTGEVYSFNFVYSGNFTGQVEVDQYKNTRVAMGINPFQFNWLLEPGKCFQPPEVIMTYSSNGLDEMSQEYHKLYTTRLCRGNFQNKPRPILINNWEATYFDFNAEKLKDIIKSAKDLGIELFVLDDGWFGKRDNDLSSLGDWFVDKKKLPNGLEDIASYANSLGMEFGLWFEPEMISQDSDLYRKNPDWCIHTPNRDPIVGRNQLVLDLSRQDVCDYLIESISDILSKNNISYVKWDMNRHMTHIGSSALGASRQREVPHRYILGLYHIMETLVSRFPNVLFESCSSGGGRFDAGMLYYMPQTWTSDNTDAICRLKIQYGTSLLYPPITMGAHISTCPNHQVGRITPLETRGHVAMSGNLGYELDLTKLTDEEKLLIKGQISKYKEIRNTIQFGRFHRILSPFEGNETAWNFISKDEKEVVAFYFKTLSEPATSITTLKLKGLDPNRNYINLDTSEIFGGDELIHVGITLPRIKKDFISLMFHFKSLDDY